VTRSTIRAASPGNRFHHNTQLGRHVHPDHQEDAIKIHLNRDRCEGYGFCEEKAPNLVALDDDGELTVLVDEIDDTRLGSAQQAVRSCPVAALSLIESP